MLPNSYYKECYDYFNKVGIWDDDESQFKRNFIKWSLKNHPDKNIGNKEIADLYQKISGCRAHFLDDFSKYSSLVKMKDGVQICPVCGEHLNSFDDALRHYMYAHNFFSTQKSKKSKSAKSKPKKSKAKKTKSTKRKSAKKSKSKKAKKSKSVKRKSKKAKSKKAKKSKSVKRKSKKAKKSKSKKAKSKKAKKSKSVKRKSKKAKKSKSVKRKSKKAKKEKSTKRKSAKKQKGSGNEKTTVSTNPREFKIKMSKRVPRGSPLRNEIKFDETQNKKYNEIRPITRRRIVIEKLPPTPPIIEESDEYNQTGTGKNDEYMEHLKQMRKPFESVTDSLSRLQNEHGLSMKDALYIGVAEKMYPKEAKKYYDTIQKLTNEGKSLQNAVQVAFENYMKFYNGLKNSKSSKKYELSNIVKILKTREYF